MSVLSVEVGNVVTRRRPIRKEMQLPVLLLLITFRPEFEAPSASGALQDVKFSTDSAGLLAAWNSQMSSSSEELARMGRNIALGVVDCISCMSPRSHEGRCRAYRRRLCWQAAQDRRRKPSSLATRG